MLVDSGTVLKKMPINLRDTSVHGDSFENYPSRQTAYNASIAFRNQGNTFGAPRRMTTADGMKGLERFVSTIDRLVHDLDGQNFILAVNLREVRETEHRIHVFALTKVSMNCVLSSLLI